MDLIQSVEGLGSPRPLPPRGAAATAQPVPVIAAYRRFLAEPGLENEFHTVRALAHRAGSAGEDRRRLRAQAASADLEAGRLARADDEELRPRLSFATGTTVALLLAAVDTIPAYLAAQAFGLDQPTTIGITAVLIAGLACAMWATAHYHSGWRRWVVVTVLGAGLITIGLLRWWYLVVTAGDVTSAVLEAAGLTIFTTLIVGLGVAVLSLTKARHVSQAESRARVLGRRAERAAVIEATLGKRFDLALREFEGRARVFSSHNLDDEESRDRFAELVRSEVEG